MEYDLTRFVSIQEENNPACSQGFSYYNSAIEEIKNGKKETHWIWFILPQIKGLGTSYNSSYYGLSGLKEAKAYLEHPLLAKRLFKCFELILETDTNLDTIFKYDEKKVRACVTLFSKANDHHSDLFDRVIEKHFNNQHHEKTLELLGL
jgi:uncharacterized protein (DUF1810 family)